VVTTQARPLWRLAPSQRIAAVEQHTGHRVRLIIDPKHTERTVQQIAIIGVVVLVAPLFGDRAGRYVVIIRRPPENLVREVAYVLTHVARITRLDDAPSES
jgi:hypothetical protein